MNILRTIWIENEGFYYRKDWEPEASLEASDM